MRPPSFFLKHPLQIISSFLKKYGKWIPDAIYLRIQYRILMGKRLNLRNPQTFTEKIQWLKINHRTPEMSTMVDKLAVKKYVSNKIGTQYVIPTLGVWDSLESVDWESLPKQFVLKTTHGGGGTGVVVIKDKNNVLREQTLERLRWSFNDEGYTRNREWPYKNVPRRIIAEKYIQIPEEKIQSDYKVYCFNGLPTYIQVSKDKYTNESMDFYDINWNHQELMGINPAVRGLKDKVSAPKNLKDIILAAKELSKGHKFLRIDINKTEEEILIGELIYFSSSCIDSFTQNNKEFELKKLIDLNMFDDSLSKDDNLIDVDNKSHSVKRGPRYLIYTNLRKMIHLSEELFDYKFFCFDGKPKILKVDFGRFSDHHANYYDMNWNIQNFGELNYKPKYDYEILPPINFGKMKEIAEILSKGHKFIRIDLYNLLGKIYFGEMTFYPASGFEKWTDIETDYKLGSMISL